jgi:hypothetical protein
MLLRSEKRPFRLISKIISSLEVPPVKTLKTFNPSLGFTQADLVLHIKVKSFFFNTLRYIYIIYYLLLES